jgi:hypothetical protein
MLSEKRDYRWSLVKRIRRRTIDMKTTSKVRVSIHKEDKAESAC